MASQNPGSNEQPNAFLRFSGMTFTMAGFIGVAVWLGQKWDETSGWEQPIGTLVGGVLGTVAAIWVVIRELSK
ncbi:MAG: AtpZ/AtpI family protein [Bacteroidota bacterium]|nr:AtpZ/AtpI family protein [Bacteroidota bacterium]